MWLMVSKVSGVSVLQEVTFVFLCACSVGPHDLPAVPVGGGVQCSVLSARCAVLSVQCAVCSVLFLVCSVQCAVCSVQCAVFSV